MKKKWTHQEIAILISQYLNNGGSITRLEKIPMSSYIRYNRGYTAFMQSALISHAGGNNLKRMRYGGANFNRNRLNEAMIRTL